MTRQQDTLDARAAADEFATERGLPRSGGYSGDWYINGYLRGSWLPDWPYWCCDYGVPAGARLRPSAPVHQYTSSPIDSNVMYDSEIVQQGEPDVQIPVEYQQKFGIGPTDVQGLIDNLEGVIMLRYQQGVQEGEAAAADALAKLNQIKTLIA